LRIEITDLQGNIKEDKTFRSEGLDPPKRTLGGLVIGKEYQFISESKPIKMFRNRGSEIWADDAELDNPDFTGDSLWKVIPGLIGDAETVTLQSTNNPDLYIRHSGYEAYAHGAEGDGPHAADASFYVWKTGATIQLESVNFPGMFFRHIGEEFRLGIGELDGS
jgi:hypothetical protein